MGVNLEIYSDYSGQFGQNLGQISGFGGKKTPEM